MLKDNKIDYILGSPWSSRRFSFEIYVRLSLMIAEAFDKVASEIGRERDEV